MCLCLTLNTKYFQKFQQCKFGGVEQCADARRQDGGGTSGGATVVRRQLRFVQLQAVWIPGYGMRRQGASSVQGLHDPRDGGFHIREREVDVPEHVAGGGGLRRRRDSGAGETEGHRRHWILVRAL